VEGCLDRLVRAGRYDPSSIVELGSIIKGDVAPRNGPTDINLFRDSRGGVGDLAMANWVYERARERGIGLEVEL
jgi:ornithine cyclodeaminase/alanine dehydrogenase-like protein (mu-crystallin family)